MGLHRADRPRQDFFELLRRADALRAGHPAAGAARLRLFAVGVICFGVPLQSASALVNLLYRRLSQIAVRNGARLAAAMSQTCAGIG